MLRLTAIDQAGNQASTSVAVTVDTRPPATPQGLTAALAESDASLAWQANAEDDLAGYYVYRNGTQVATVTGTVHTDSGLAAQMLETKISP